MLEYDYEQNDLKLVQVKQSSKHCTENDAEKGSVALKC